MKVLQISTFDNAGGAEKIAKNLFDGYRSKGHDSWLCVGEKQGQEPYVFEFPQAKSEAIREGRTRSSSGASINVVRRKIRRLRSLLTNPLWSIRRELGHEDFDFPGTWSILGLSPDHPDIVHCHNLHGGYFDLRALPWLSHQTRLVLTLHDAWLLTGHCAHFFDCERWREGCGSCPDLSIPPAVRRDATAFNWRRKRDIYCQSRLYVTTPCRWLMDRVNGSMLAAAVAGSKIIPNGVDVSVFCPLDKQRVRDRLGLPVQAKILLFAANGVRNNPWKDFQMLREAIASVAVSLVEKDLLFIALGEDSSPENIGSARLTYVPYQEDPAIVSQYYQAADVYVHAAKADTFPNSVLEALACGIPVVATAVGGITEQVEEGYTGFLVPPGDAKAMAHRIVGLLRSADETKRMGQKAGEVARERYSLGRQVDAYLNWYQEILDNTMSVAES